jgi:hypothetical protein
MKPIGFFTLLCAALCWAGCAEKEIIIPELKAGKRKVLVEELTGVRCQGCPDGTRQLIDLQRQYGKKNLIVLSIHAAGNFSQPYTSPPANLYDFRFPKANELANYIGDAEGYPTASINRQALPGAQSLFVSRDKWAGLIAEEFAQDFEINLLLGKTYDPETRNVRLETTINPLKTLTGDLRLTLFMAQDSIVDVQQDGATRVPNYVHRHVLRHILTASDGDRIPESLDANALILKAYDLTLDPAWEPKHCSVIAVLHRGENSDKEVIQVTETYILE